MDFFSPIRRLNWLLRDKAPARRPAPKKRLALERLESRELLAVAPFVTSVTPATGGTLGTSIVVTYSENVTGAATASNYQLFDGSGAPVSIGIVSYNPTTFQATIAASSLNGGAPLVAGSYSLFLRGDRIIDLDDNLPVSRPGEIVVANSGRGNVSTVSLQPDGALGALTNLPLPPKGTTNAAPTAIALQDINADGVRDLLIGNTGFNTVSIFLGGPNGEFASTPDAELDLGPSGSPTDIAVADLNADSKNDILVTSSGTNSVLVFLNTASANEISFAARVAYAAGNTPNGIVLGRFNNDNFLDVAVSNSTADGSNNYTVNVLTGRGDGTFNATVAFTVGNTTPTNLTTPTGIAVGRFNGDTLDDLAVSGGSGLAVLTNTSTTATPAFSTAFIARTVTTTGTVATSVTTGVFRSNANSQPDILVATNDNGGQLILYVNNGSGTFQATAAVAAAAASPFDVTARDLTGDGRPEIVYANNVATGGVVSQAPLQAGLVEAATNAAPIVITSTAHGLANGQRVTVAGVGGNTAANGTFFVANVTANTFELVGSAGNGPLTTGTGTWVALPGTITNVSGNGTSPIVITSPNHGLRSGQQVTVAGVGGNTAANGTFFITRISATQFSLNGTTGNGAYTANTGTWSLAPYPTGGGPVRLALGDTNADGILDLVTANQTASSVAYYRGSGTGGVGDGTFLAASALSLTSTTPVPNSVAVGDVNNDGVPDLVVSDFSVNRVNVLLGLAQGGYAPAVSFTTQTGNLGRQPVSVALGDVNDDGNLDIVVASQQDNVVSILRGGGNGTFQAPTTVSVGRTPTEVVLADFDKDGHLDLLVAHNGGGGGGFNRGVTFRRGVGDGTFFAAQEIATGTRAAGLAVADFNRDGNLDFAVIDNNAPGRVRIRLGNGVGGFTNGGDFTVGSNPIDIQAADMNSDGFVDLVTVSSSGTTTNHVSVLINALGTGFQTAINTTLPSGTPLRSVAVVNANGDPFPDLVVGAAVPPGTPAPPQPNNLQVLLGQGNGTFQVDTDLFTAGGTGTPELVPSYVAVVNDALVPLTTFVVGGNLISADLVRNGSFDARDLTDEEGNLTGWRTFRLNDPNRGSAGQWSAQTGTSSPLSLTTVISPASGRYQAMLDQQHLRPFLPGIGPGSGNPNSDESYAGSHAIYQDIFIPANITSARLSLRLYINSDGPLSDTNAVSLLDYRVTGDNQQVRVDVMRTTGDILDVGTGVLQNLFLTNVGQTQTQTVNLTNVDLSAFAGQTIRLRVASTNNRGKLIVGLENVRLQATLSDSVSPTLVGLGLRNPSYLSDLTPLVQATDATLVGQVGDNAGPNNIRQITFDVNNDGFGNSDDLVTQTIDAQGRFSFTLPENTLPGPRTVTVRVTDRGGNFTDQAFTFIIQGPSLVTWTSEGPGPVNIASEGLNYQTAAGKITSVAVDPRDASGNTIYIGAPNGGVWKTVNGGKDWQAMTDNVTTGTGERIPTPVGALAITQSGVIYAATGVEDVSFTSRSSQGILRSTNDGRSWTVLGESTFRGAQIAKLVVDARNDNVVYVAVSGWDDATKEPGIYKTTNGGRTWTNVLIPTNMFQPGRVTTLPAGTALATVTDMIIDPFNPDRLLIGLGNIGKRTANGTAGVWKSIDGGQTWEKQVGGDDPSIPFNTIPEGTVVGRVTLAQGNGRVGDERFVYVLMSTPPSGTFNAGSTLGLYKSKDNLLNFTKVLLTEEDITSAPGAELFNPIEMHGREGANVGALVVDPSNPNVVYVGGSRRFTLPDDPQQHGVIRVDTGNMRDTTYRLPDLTIPNDGDDITKALTALNMATPNTYPPPDESTPGAAYTGEGVYWYDIEMDGVNDGSNLRRLAPSVYAMTFDPQGRLLMGTVHGIFRGVSRGYGYDFTTGGGLGIVRGQQRNFNPAGMTITQLNGNLQIADLTSAAIDPNDRDRLYFSAADIGTGLTNAGQLAWVTSGLNGNGLNSDTPSAFQVLVAPPTPGAPSDALTTVYRVWQNRGVQGSLIPESSPDSGETYGSLASAGISINETAGVAPVLAVNPKKVEVAGQFYDELLFGTSRVYLTRTSSNVWDQISPRLSATGFVSALAFAPSESGVYYAGTDDGGIYYQAPGLNWPLRATGLPTGVRINGLMVDPNNANTAYAMLGGRTGIAHVYRTTNAGQSWQALGGTGTSRLPDVSAYTMVIDKRALPGAPNGLIYVGTDVGVYVTTDGGVNWKPFGQGLPTVPVVNLEFNQDQEQLVAATQGRGIFSISTARSGPYVTANTPTTPQEDPLTEITITFSTPVDPRTLTPEGNVPARLAITDYLRNFPEYFNTRTLELFKQYLRRGLNPGEDLTGLASLIPQPNGDALVTATILASPQYFSERSASTNSIWLNNVYLDLYGRDTSGDPTAAAQLVALNNGTQTRQQVAQTLVGTQEYLRNLSAKLLTRYLGLAYPAQAPTTDARINSLVASLNAGTPVAGVIAQLLASTEAYAKMGTTYAVPVGTTASALAFGNFSGAKDSFGNFIPDLAVGLAGSNVVQIFKGRTGGGYDTVPTLTLTLPTGASAADLIVADFNKDGKDDLAVANGGLSGGASVSVFLNLSTTVGQILFGARQDLNGGFSPVGLAVANVDNDGSGNLDLLALSGAVNGVGNYVVSVLLGDGAGGFSAPTTFKVGDSSPSPSEISNPTGIAVANVTGDSKPDVIVSGASGVGVFTNTTATPGAPTFASLAARVSDRAATSVAAGLIDTNATVDIAFTTDTNGGQVVVLQNSGAGTFTATVLESGPSPRSVQLRDFDGDKRLDVIVADAANSGAVEVRLNKTVTASAGADTVTFGTGVRYATQGNTPTVIRLADTNQDGILDVAAGHSNSPDFTVLTGLLPGVMRGPGDVSWLLATFRALYNRNVTTAEINNNLSYLSTRQVATLSGPGGSYSPVSVTPADETGLTYTLGFSPLVLDGTYTLTVGPNQAGVNIKDLVDRDGTYNNIGNPMNQNKNTINGEFPGDRFIERFVVNTSDTGRFITQLYNDLLGKDPNGRDPDTNGFLSFHPSVEAARLQALKNIAPNAAGSQERRIKDVADLYTRFLRRTTSPLSATNPEIAPSLAALNNGTQTQLDLWVSAVASAEYFTNPALGNSNNGTWVNQAYLDLLGRPVEPGAGWEAMLNAGTITRSGVARSLLFSPEGLNRVINQAYLRLNGRYATADEMAFWRPQLTQPTSAGGPGSSLAGGPMLTPYERLDSAIVTMPEYLRVVGNSDKAWMASLYTRMLGRATIDPNSPDVTGPLNSLLNLYTPQRQAAATSLVNSAEYRARVISRYYAENLSPVTGTRVASSSEIAYWENVYQTQGQRLERVLAGILALDEYVPLNISSNSVWLNKIYNTFLFRSTAGDPTATAQLNFLNSQSLAQLQGARNQVAQQIFFGAEYRRSLVAGIYNTFLDRGKAVPPGTGDAEVNYWVSQMALGLKQEGIIAIFLATPEYFLLHT